MISRGTGRSAVAAAAYMSCSRMLNDYDGVQHDYTRKRGLLWQQVFLPSNAPAGWSDREKLWNAVEENEKTKDSRLAREFVVALPVELDRDAWTELLTEYIQANFVAEGMCADVCIHDTDGHNPHAHLMLTVRPLDENGKWQYKTEKEYLCVRDGEERGFTAKEFKAAQSEGWEKQYRYKMGRKKVYMTPSEAEAKGLTRLSKHPKSSKYGRQNPVSERWNSEEQLVLWREAWADATNRFLERAGTEERVDHRSHAERGLDEQPTVHEGVAARAMETAGIVSDRCELNRQIKADNLLLRTLKAQVMKLVAVVKNTVIGIARALETVRRNLLIFRYHVLHSGADKKRIIDTLDILRPDVVRYEELVAQIKDASKKRKALLDEKKATPRVRVIRHHELAREIAKLTEDLEELKNERTILLSQYAGTDGTLGTGVQAVRNRISFLEATLQKVEHRESKYAAELEAALAQYRELQEQAKGVNADALDAARQSIRPDMEREAYQQAREVYGKRYDSDLMKRSQKDVAAMLEEKRTLSVQVQTRETRIKNEQKADKRAATPQNLER